MCFTVETYEHECEAREKFEKISRSHDSARLIPVTDQHGKKWHLLLAKVWGDFGSRTQRLIAAESPVIWTRYPWGLYMPNASDPHIRTMADGSVMFEFV